MSARGTKGAALAFALAARGAKGAALALALAAAGCQSEASPAPDAPTRRAPPEQPKGPAQVTPVAQACAASCPRLDPAGPLVELDGPFDDSSGAASIAYAGGSWYVAWGGSGPAVTHVQRFTAEGKPEGDTRRITGTGPGPLLANAANELTLFGTVEGSYSPDGLIRSLVRLGPDLSLRRAPITLRAPSISGTGVDAVAEADGGLTLTDLQDRPGGLVRETRVAADAPLGPLVSRDWRPASTSNSTALLRVGGARVFFETAEGALRARPLLDDGALGEARRVFELPTGGTERYALFGVPIGDAFWVGATEITSGPMAIRLCALDPATLAPRGTPIELTWPDGHAYSIVNANGTPMLRGDLGGAGDDARASFVPVDTAARAACRPSTLVIATLATQHQTVRAIRFEGDKALAAIDVWGQGARRMFAAPLRCGPLYRRRVPLPVRRAGALLVEPKASSGRPKSALVQAAADLARAEGGFPAA